MSVKRFIEKYNTHSTPERSRELFNSTQYMKDIVQSDTICMQCDL